MEPGCRAVGLVGGLDQKYFEHFANPLDWYEIRSWNCQIRQSNSKKPRTIRWPVPALAKYLVFEEIPWVD